MHPADRQVMARAGAAELFLHVAQFRIAVAQHQRAEQRMIERLLSA